MAPATESARPSRLGLISAFGGYVESCWLGKKFSKQFWIFFTAALLYDFGFGLFFFFFNLFLTNMHYRENILGLITGALTMGTVAGSIPMSIFSRRFGLQRALLLGFVAGPLICILRVTFLGIPVQIGLAFLTGFALSSWTVCFSPTVARLTTEENRITGFSIVFATGLGSGTLAGLAGGYLPQFIKSAHQAHQPADDLRLILLLACAVAFLGVVPLLLLRLGRADSVEKISFRRPHRFLLRFLPAFFAWSIVVGSLSPFAAVYLQQQLHLPLKNIGAVFSATRLAEFLAILLAPLLFRRFGTVFGIIGAQISAGIAVFALACVHNPSAAIPLYLGFFGFQFMCSPGIYSLLMTQLRDEDRSSASALQNMTGALTQSGAAIVTGTLLVKFGYSLALVGNAAIALAAALLTFLLLGFANRQPPPAAQSLPAG